ncbi:MYXO-CTERM domain-containing protein [Nannocystis exedens]|uniref:MYXO-CTERM domain-containing protein n=2 Tax=Nannocystis exedens TaxID=54 RepID=A0A1I1V259_9BACT|nr:hypothetical protein NAEX_05373 [Nannocystis exedens]SFD77121.1 MYXO-CTERM domain-containing protein [Nannocystis exedens]
MVRIGWMVFCAVAFTACDPPEMVSERGDFRLVVDGLSTARDLFTGSYWDPPYPVLAGTRICPELRCQACPEEGACDDAAVHASGPVAVDEDGCFVVESPGEVVWTVDPSCGAPGQQPDRVRMRVVGPDAVEARVTSTLDAMVVRHAMRDNPVVTAFGADWLALLPREFKVVAGEQVAIGVGLFEPGTNLIVARQSEPEAAVTWTTTRGRAPITYPSQQLELVTFAGTESEASFEFAGHRWPLARVTGVPADAATSLELAGAFYFMEDADAPLIGRTSVPFAARAVARDDAGDLVVGLPVTWSAEVGNMAYWPEMASPEQLILSDDCVAPEDRDGPRELVLRARHGDLSASLEFTWAGTREPAPFNFVEPDSSWEPPDTCLAPAGCGCRSGEPGGAALLLGLLLLGRRRRKSHVRTGMLAGTCLLALPAGGCGGAPSVRAAEAIPLGDVPLQRLADLSVEQGGHSVAVGDRTVWAFRTATRVRPYETTTAAAVTADFDARDGLHPFTAFVTADEDDDDALLPYVGREGSYRHDHGGDCTPDEDCPKVSLWPGPMVHDPERQRVLIFYRKVIQLPDNAENQHVGSSIAVWRDDLGGRPIRPEVAEGSAETTLLFGPEGPRISAALVEDEHVFAFACGGRGSACTLLRAPLAHALERDAWRFYADGGWSPSPRRPDELFEGAGAMSVHFSAHAGAYVAVYADREEPAVVLRTASQLEGPWSDAAELVRPRDPQRALMVRDALLHPELARDGGAVDYLTFYEAYPSENGPEGGTLQLVEIHWE